VKVKKLVLHCNGYDGRTWRDILRTHLGKSWFGIGYHAVVHEDGSVHPGRKETRPGAHTQGLNACSLALCLIGNLDAHAPTDEAYIAAVKWFAIRMLRHGLTPADVIGHREAAKHGGKPVRKTCPGACVDMDVFRENVGRHAAVLRAAHERAVMNCPACRVLPFHPSSPLVPGFRLMREHAAFAKPCKEHADVA
jgi:N-acetylmuramoyl-L-alanine amidase